MISIIVCSINNKYFEQLKKSIEDTIGDIPYEIIRIDNNKEKLSITKAYNLGISKSNYNYLVFVHEDVLFHTNNWGTLLVNIFERDKEMGLLGVSGAKYKSKFPSAGWHTKDELLNINIYQHYNNGNKPAIDLKGFASDIEDVVVIDGVFMVLDKSKGIVFNEKINGFHCYDLAISLDVLKSKYKVKVTNQILIEHLSIGNANVSFIESILRFHRLYKNQLPMSLNQDINNLEIIALGKFLSVCLSNRFIPFRLWLTYFIHKPLNRLNYNFLKLMIFKALKE